MVLLVERLSKLYCKLEGHLHHSHESEALQASFQAFQSNLSVCLNQLSFTTKPGSEFFSFPWIQQCFELLPSINKAFAKLVVDIDYPMSKWEADSVEEYLNYSLCLLELLNSITSTISHLGQARLALSHALGLVEKSRALAIKRLSAIQVKSSSPRKELKEPEDKEGDEAKAFANKERVIHQALIEIKSIGFWACGVILAGLSGDAEHFLKMRKSQGFSNSALSKLDSSICEVIKGKGGVLKEVKELNDSAACLAAAADTSKSRGVTEELQRRLDVFEKLLDSLGKEVDHLFSKLLAGRNELLDGIRHHNK